MKVGASCRIELFKRFPRLSTEGKRHSFREEILTAIPFIKAGYENTLTSAIHAVATSSAPPEIDRFQSEIM